MQGHDNAFEEPLAADELDAEAEDDVNVDVCAAELSARPAKISLTKRARASCKVRARLHVVAEGDSC